MTCTLQRYHDAISALDIWRRGPAGCHCWFCASCNCLHVESIRSARYVELLRQILAESLPYEPTPEDEAYRLSTDPDVR
jgi:hypothetical protein